MTGSPPFRLLYLPMLVLYEIFKMWDPIDTFAMSTLSNRCAMLLRKPVYIELQVDGSNPISLVVKLKKDHSSYLSIKIGPKSVGKLIHFSWKLGKINVPVAYYPPREFWDGRTIIFYIGYHSMKSFEELGKFLIKSFLVPEFSVFISKETFLDRNYAQLFGQIYKFKLALRVPIRRFHLKTDYIAADAFQPLLNSFSDTPELILECSTWSRFSYSHVRPYPKDMLKIENATWFKEILCLLKCKNVELKNVAWKAIMWNRLLKGWLEVGCRLEEVKITGNLEKFEEAFEGIRVMEVEDKTFELLGETKIAARAYILERASDAKYMICYHFEERITVYSIDKSKRDSLTK